MGGMGSTKVVKYDAALLDAVDAAVREVIPPAQRFEPDDLRGG
jgi:hypothetical protein